MSAWLVGLTLGAGYLITKNLNVHSMITNAAAAYKTGTPADGKVTTSEIRQTYATPDAFGPSTEVNSQHKSEVEAKMYAHRQEVAAYEPAASEIQGVWLSLDRGVY